MKRILISVFAFALAPAVAGFAADAAETRRSKASARYYNNTAQTGYQRDNSYAARASNADPAGNYKGYPDWARVALSGNGNTRGGR